jgi:hypothetical protein
MEEQMMTDPTNGCSELLQRGLITAAGFIALAGVLVAALRAVL